MAGVGENLRDHYGARLTARAKNVDTINELAHGPKLVGEIVKYFLGRRSILELGPTLVYCFWHSDETIRNADLQISFTPASYDEGKQAKLGLIDFSHTLRAPRQQRGVGRYFQSVHAIALGRCIG